MQLWDRLLGLKGLQLYYLVWQLPLLVTARKLHRTQPFDIAHHATMTNDWIPSGLAYAGIPAFVWGPLGGSERVPRSCSRFLGPRGRVIEWIRPVISGALRPWASRASKRATLLVAQNDDEAVSLRRHERPVITSPNVFLDPSWFGPALQDTPTVPHIPRGDRRQVLFVSRLLAWKGIHLALETMRRTGLAEWELHIYGHGPERRRAQSEIRRWGLEHRVFLHEPVSRSELKVLMENADALLYPSMRDAASWVVGEALAVGCPVVCLDVGGPPILVRSCGVAVAIEGDVPGNLANALAATSTARTVVRWGDDRVPDLITDWYTLALGCHAEEANQSLPRP
jgi:glycosyltransferase involved in cell wall biosynthesis